MNIISKLKQILSKKYNDKQDMSHTPSNVEEQPSLASSEIITRKQINNTPFWIIRIEEGYFLCIGDKRLTGIYKKELDVREYMRINKWMLTMQLIMVIIEELNKKPA